MISTSKLAAVLATAGVLLAACSTQSTQSIVAPTAGASWQVDNAKSSFNFVTTKAGQAGTNSITEVSSFKRFAGGVDAQGTIELVIDLASVDTGIEIRDERVKTILFNVGATPQAKFAAKIDPAFLRNLSSTAVSDIAVKGTLTIAAQTKPAEATLRVSRIGAASLQVSTLAPIVVNANDYGLKAGVEGLRDLMGLNVLSPAAPISFALVMNEKR